MCYLCCYAIFSYCIFDYDLVNFLLRSFFYSSSKNKFVLKAHVTGLIVISCCFGVYETLYVLISTCRLWNYSYNSLSFFGNRTSYLFVVIFYKFYSNLLIPLLRFLNDSEMFFAMFSKLFFDDFFLVYVLMLST